MDRLKLDILAIGAHPDDVELGAGGTVVRHVEQGKAVGVLDLTQGELGTRGNAQLRLEEAGKASVLLGVQIRHNLALPDGFFKNDRESQIKIIEQLRRFQPEIVLAPSITDRHPDHGRAAELVSEACFYSGLARIETTWENQPQQAWRPKAVYHFIQDRYIKPNFVVDISDHMEQKMAAVMAFASQFHDPDSQEPSSPISSPEFLEHVKGRALDFGRLIGATYGEGFTTERAAGIDDLMLLR